MTKTFYFNGCSLTYGDDLKSPQENRYSKLVCDNFGVHEVNQSLCGGSNYRIQRQFTKYVSQNNPDLVFIMWSHMSRVENVYLNRFILDQDRLHQQIQARWVLEHEAIINRSNELEIIEFNKEKERRLAYEYFYTHIHTSENQILNWLDKVLAIQNYCKSNGIFLVMTYAFPEIHAMLKWGLCHDNKLLRDEVNFYFNQIDWSTWINGGDWNFREFNDIELKLPLGPIHHPLEDAHKEAAKIFINFIKEKYGKELNIE
jgi:hypothetical protein